MEPKKIIIVGGVAGGASCATRLRRHGEQFDIVLLERGPQVSFANCGLPYFVGGVIEQEEDLYLADVELFQERFGIDARVNSEVVDIDEANKTVRVNDLKKGAHYTLPYDELVLAPGASPLRPCLPGIDLDGIFSLRNVPDSQAIKDWIAAHKAKRAVVVGAGFIGLEMAENLVHLGIHTTVVERNLQVLPPLDQEMSVPLRQAIQERGVALYLGDSVTEFNEVGKGGSRKLSVQTESGKEVHADIVVLAIGVTPENALAQAAGLDLGERGHVLVDANMRTSNPSIYAIGDCIEVRNAITKTRTALPLAGPANRQGRIAADMIAGRGRHFRGVQGTAVCGLFGMTAATTGLNEKTLKSTGSFDYGAVYAHPLDHVGYYPGASPIYLKLLYDKVDGRLLGAQAVGEAGVARRIDVIAMAIQMKATVFDLEESELCYAPQFGAAKDPVNVIGMIAANEMRGDLRITHWDKMGEAGSVTLDVRSVGEVNERPLPNALHIPLNEIRARHAEIPADKKIYVSCAVGARAYNAVRLLGNLGFQASLLSGGEKTFSQLEECHLSCEDCWEARDRMDFLLSWEVLRDAVADNDALLREHLGLMQNPRVFAGLPMDKLTEAFRRMEAIEVKKGAVIMQQGKPGDYFYLIKQGEAEVWQQGLYDDAQQHVATLGVGYHFGEEALVTDGVRNATVKMRSKGILLRLGSDDFNTLVTESTLEQIDVETAQSLMNNGHQVLDVRYEEEFNEQHIEGVQLIPLPELRTRLDELDADKPYITVCLSGKRSAVAAMILRQQNFKVASLKEGLRDWPGEMVAAA